MFVPFLTPLGVLSYVEPRMFVPFLTPLGVLGYVEPHVCTISDTTRCTWLR
jgi:hypothetical protein